MAANTYRTTGLIKSAATGAVNRVPQDKWFEVVSVLDFGAVGDGTTDDSAALIAFAAAVDAGAHGILSGIYKSTETITFNANNIKLQCNAELVFDDTMANTTTVAAASGKIGLYFKECDHLQLTGALKVRGTGTIGTTKLAGVVFDNCEDVQAPCSMKFEQLAGGRFLIDCIDSQFGDCSGYRMNGTQTFSAGADTAGTVEIVVSCTRVTSGRVIGDLNYKPVRYMSVGGSGANNTHCEFGATVLKGSGSAEAIALAIRNAVDCAFGPVLGETGTHLLWVGSYSGDTGEVDRVNIVSVNGEAPTSAASVDAAIYVGGDVANIGNITIGSAAIIGGGEYGLYHSQGTLNFGVLEVSGNATRPAATFSSGVGVAALNIDKLILRPGTSTARTLSLGRGAKLVVGIVDIKNGPQGGAASTAAVGVDTALGDAGAALPEYSIGTIKYDKNGSAQDYLYLFFDGSSAPAANRSVLNVLGTGTSGASRWGSDNFSRVENGRLHTLQAPTSAAWTQGSIVYDDTPSAAGKIGWVCTTAGTPGTWKPFGAIDA